MDKVRQNFSPKESGWYIGLKHNDEQFVFYVKDPATERYEIHVPWEFSSNPNFKFFLDSKLWNVMQMNVADNVFTQWCTLKQIQPLKDSITTNAELEMEYRKSLIGSKIKFNDVIYKILGVSVHIHCWTIYNIENVETKSQRQIQLEGYDNWSSGGIDKIEVEILFDQTKQNDD